MLCIIIIGGAFILVYFTVLDGIKKNYQKEINVLSEQLKTNTVYVYAANKSIPAGSKITKEDVEYIKSYTKQDQEYYMTKDEIGMVSLIDIKEGTHILKGMLTKNTIDNNLRELEYNTFLINSNIKENDSIDVRITFPNGEDYIVLSKKNIKNLSLDINNCFLWLTEDEILTMSAAIVDTYLYSGTKLYTAKYIEPSLQDASIPTYQPSISTLTLMEQDVNIVEKASKEINKRLRKELENRLEIDLLDTNANESVTSTINNDVISNQIKNENEAYFIQEDEQVTEDIVEYGG